MPIKLESFSSVIIFWSQTMFLWMSYHAENGPRGPYKLVSGVMTIQNEPFSDLSKYLVTCHITYIIRLLILPGIVIFQSLKLSSIKWSRFLVGLALDESRLDIASFLTSIFQVLVLCHPSTLTSVPHTNLIPRFRYPWLGKFLPRWWNFRIYTKKVCWE